MDDQPHYGNCCRLVRQSSNGSSSGWSHLIKVLADLEAYRDSNSPPTNGAVERPEERAKGAATGKS